MKKLLWLSRHEMTEPQLSDLKRIFGKFEIHQVEDTVKSAQEIIDHGKNCDILAVVLPIQLQEQLLRLTDKPVISAKNNRIDSGKINEKGEKIFNFEFDHWFRIKEVKIITEKL